MATVYQVADGHDNEAGFTPVVPQPKCEGIQATRRTYCPDGTIKDEGLFVELVFNLVPDVTTYQSILNQFGIQSASTNEVTVTVRDQTFASVNKNGMAVQPLIGVDVNWSNYFPRDIKILVKDLSAT